VPGALPHTQGLADFLLINNQLVLGVTDWLSRGVGRRVAVMIMFIAGGWLGVESTWLQRTCVAPSLSRVYYFREVRRGTKGMTLIVSRKDYIGGSCLDAEGGDERRLYLESEVRRRSGVERYDT
jgi:hypothetical protein